MAFQLNGQPIALDTAFTHAGIQYPANWLRLASTEERAAIGITEVADAESYDQRFYWGPNNPKLLNDREESDERGNPLYVKVLDPVSGQMIDSSERLVTKGLKSQWVAQIKDTANKALATTDWYIVRKAEGGDDVPAKVSTYRAAVRAECNRLETEINGASNVEGLIAVINSANWPVNN